MHPSNKGHAALAELLSEPLRRALHERQTGAALTAQDRRGDKRLDELPPPMIPNSLDETPSLCAMLVSCPRLGAPISGGPRCLNAAQP